MRIATATLLIAIPMLASAQPKPPEHTLPATPPPAHARAATPAAPGKPPHSPALAAPSAAAASKRPAARPAAKPAVKPPIKPPIKPPAPSPAPAPPPPEQPRQGSKTGLPLPRFAALKSDDVNFRRGPGDRYPIEWVYKRRDLPVEIEREFDEWRLVSDPQGTKGWVHSATLSFRRTGIVVGGEHVLRQAASESSGAVAKIEQGVILRLRSCEAKSDWCQAASGDYRGFVKRSEIWGILPGEVIQ